MLIIVAKLSLLRDSLIVMILSLIGCGISVSFVTICFFIVKPTPSFSFGFAIPEERIFQVVETSILREPCFIYSGDVDVVFGKFHCY